MTDEPGISCPFCRSENVLPYEEESPGKSGESLFIVILLAMLLIGAYFFFVISSYLFFPAVVFFFIILSTWLINRAERKKTEAKQRPRIAKDHICLDCSQSFKA